MVNLENEQEKVGYGILNYHWRKAKKNPLETARQIAYDSCKKYGKTNDRFSCNLGVDKGVEIIRESEAQKKKQRKEQKQAKGIKFTF
jgi:hypothetical protein